MIVYYLLYNIIDTDKLWILDIDTNFNYLYNKICDFRSKYERYYIIEKVIKYKLLDDKIKKFTLYNLNKRDKIIIKSITGLTCCLNDKIELKIKNKKTDICIIM